MPERRMCQRCVISESPPDVFLDARGVCNVCLEWEQASQAQSPASRPFLETDLTRLLARHRGRQKYDCLVMLSGGKDSTSALYTVVRKYRLNPLVFTFNHGFMPDEHLAIARRVVERLGVDWILLRSTFMREMFAEIVRSGSPTVICPVCSLWYMKTTYEVAARYDIPLILSGWTKGQTTTSNPNALTTCACNQTTREHQAMARATREFMERATRTLPAYKGFPVNMEEVLKYARNKLGSKAITLSPHWFLPTDSAEYVQTIRDELGWSCPERSYPRNTTNCELNFLSTYLAVRHHGYSHYHIEMSNLVRRRLMTREQALQALDMGFMDRAFLEPIAARLGVTWDQVEQ